MCAWCAAEHLLPKQRFEGSGGRPPVWASPFSRGEPACGGHRLLRSSLLLAYGQRFQSFEPPDSCARPDDNDRSPDGVRANV